MLIADRRPARTWHNFRGIGIFSNPLPQRRHSGQHGYQLLRFFQGDKAPETEGKQTDKEA